MADRENPREGRVRDAATEDFTELSQTVWGHIETQGAVPQEVVTSTQSPSVRTIILEDSNNSGTYTFLDANSRESIITHNSPLYEIDVPAGTSYIIRGQQKNPYIPGFVGVEGVTIQALTAAPDGQWVPDGVTLEVGHATLDDVGNENGMVKRWKPNSLEFVVYEDGVEKEVRSYENREWNRIADDLRLSPEVFAVHRNKYDLYGAGSIKHQLRTRSDEAQPTGEFETLVEVATKTDPLMNTYNHPSSVRVKNEGTSTFTIGSGPKQMYNITDAELPERRVSETFRNVSVAPAVGDENVAVLGVYRVDRDYLQVPVTPSRISVDTPDASVVETRTVDPQFLTFTADDPVNDGWQNDESSWLALDNHNSKDRATRSLDLSGGSVSLDTQADGTLMDGTNRIIPRGHSLARVTTSKKTSVEGFEDILWTMDKYRYVILTAQVNAPTIENVDIEFTERW